MANKKIKGLTVEIGGDATELGKALGKVESKASSLSQELGQINRLLKLDPGNADLLAQKHKVLTDAVATAANKLKTLKEAEAQVQEQFKRGEVSADQVRALQREIIETTNKLDKYKQIAKETKNELKNLGDAADDAADDIDDMGDAADDAEEESEDLASSLDGGLANGFKVVVGLAAAAAAAIVGCVEASHEYRTEMGKLDTAFTNSDHSSEAAKETYKELQSVLGETDQAVEAANHLAKLADNETELHQLTDALTGVYATFGASLPVESLAEAANETAKVGKVTGSFADAINWASDEGTDWKAILGSNTKALKAFEKATAEGEATEDAYTAALEACSDEQERQELIMSTLTKIYGGAAKQYKKTNKTVIEANKANEEWNETMADLGDEMAPVVVEIKKFGTEMLKNAKEPLKEVAGFLADKVLPALGNLIKWVSNNIPTIKAGLVGITAALVTYKVATIAAEVAQNGLKATLLATEAAQKLVNIAMAATPWGLVATAIAAVVAGLIAYTAATQETAQDVNILTEEEKELIASSREAAEAFRDQKAATEETAGGITSQMGHVQGLADELQKLADASGRVKEKDQERVQFILNELNEALGTEYTMTDGVVQKYDELKNSIDQVILSKTASALLEAHNADYVTALQEESNALSALVTANKDYEAQQAESLPKIAEWKAQHAEIVKKLQTGVTQHEELELTAQRANLERHINEEQALLDEKKTAYDDAAADYGYYSSVIMNYEDAQTAALQGNYDEAVRILKGKGESFDDYAANVDEATRTAIDKLFKEAVDAGIAAERTRKNFEQGVEGYTKEMVDEAEKGYEEALNAWATARADAEGIGGDLGDGLSGGMENKRNGLLAKARSLVSGIISAMKQEADSNSPSKKTMAFGEDMGEGAEIGLDNSTDDILRTARNQVHRLIDTYSNEGEQAAPRALQSINEQALSRSSATMQSVANSNASMLEKILAAIERGQILTIDGNTLVGATVGRTDAALGQQRELVARGAK